jgi:hypothetical protein
MDTRLAAIWWQNARRRAHTLRGDGERDEQHQRGAAAAEEGGHIVSLLLMMNGKFRRRNFLFSQVFAGAKSAREVFNAHEARSVFFVGSGLLMTVWRPQTLSLSGRNKQTTISGLTKQPRFFVPPLAPLREGALALSRGPPAAARRPPAAAVETKLFRV